MNRNQASCSTRAQVCISCLFTWDFSADRAGRRVSLPCSTPARRYSLFFTTAIFHTGALSTATPFPFVSSSPASSGNAEIAEWALISHSGALGKCCGSVNAEPILTVPLYLLPRVSAELNHDFQVWMGWFENRQQGMRLAISDKYWYNNCLIK